MNMANPTHLVDTFGRVHTNLRVSVTDRCNIRCVYCMPAHVTFRPREELLSFEEIRRFVRVGISLGIRKVRLTGGEPLVRADLPRLIAMLVELPGLDDLALTTNGLLLADQAEALYQAGLHRLNVSLDTLDEERFQQISRRPGIDRVLAGIHAAMDVGFRTIRLNAIAIRGFTESEIEPLVAFSRQHNLELRFIEYMPLDAQQQWQTTDVLAGDEIRRRVEKSFGKMIPVSGRDASQPATDFRFEDGSATIGFINSVTQPFCDACNRLRLTAEGQIRNCLFSTAEWDARALLRGNATDDQLRDMLVECVGAKKRGHGIDTPDFVRPERAMYQIGG
jgi:cyclic pyranopterin phosphate synthase